MLSPTEDLVGFHWDAPYRLLVLGIDETGSHGGTASRVSRRNETHLSGQSSGAATLCPCVGLPRANIGPCEAFPLLPRVSGKRFRVGIQLS
jgi:hypothetical protein